MQCTNTRTANDLFNHIDWFALFIAIIIVITFLLASETKMCITKATQATYYWTIRMILFEFCLFVRDCYSCFLVAHLLRTPWFGYFMLSVPWERYCCCCCIFLTHQINRRASFICAFTSFVIQLVTIDQTKEKKNTFVSFKTTKYATFANE